MTVKKVQLYLDRDKTIEASPETSANCVILSDGNDLQKVLDNDLTNPTVVHEETSFKVGVGDINVSSSVVDGEVGRMVIKGKTYQNILPEPSTHVLTNNKEMFKVNEGLDPNVEIVDGVSKSAILSGQTWVNGLSNPVRQGKVSYATLVSPTHVIFNHGDNPTEERVNVVYEWFGGKMGDGVDYTLDIWILKNTMRRKTDPNATIGKINFNSYNNGFYPIPSNTLGHITHEVTTSTTNAGGKPYIETFATCEGELEIQMVIRQGRNLEPIDRHFEGVASCKMPVLTTKGKNLYPYGDIIKETSDIVNIWKTDILVKSGQSVTYSGKGLINATNDKRLQLIISSTKEQPIRGEIIDELKRVSLTDFNGENSLTITNDSGKDGYLFIRIVNGSVTYSIDNIQIEQGSTSTTRESYKSNILHTPEEVVLKGIGDLKDTLNCNTGEYVERIGEYIITGDENWNTNTQNDCQRFSFYHTNIPIIRNNGYSDSKIYVNCDKLAGVVWSNSWNTLNTITTNNGSIYFHLPLETTMEQAKTMMIGTKIQYVLETPTVKTVDLSSSGNWEKVILDGSEDEGWFSNFTDLGDGYYRFQGNLSMLKNPYKNKNNYGMGFSDSFKWSTSWTGKSEGFYFDSMIVIRILGSKLPSLSIEGCMQYLQQNPLTIYYLTATHQDSTQVKQPIFFKDGHIQLSSGADNSLIPTLDYQAKTSNSYVMDLMKTNTKYTMKAKSASGTFTIDGTSYGAGTNGTFTTPSSMTNKFLVMSNKTNEEVMILEGDVVSKTIPYFKGIKSAFEDESKIEVLSQGKNLLDPSKFCGDERWLTLNNDQTISISQTASGAWYYLYKDLKIPTNTYITLEVLEGTYEGGNVGLFRNGEKLKELWWGDEGKKVHTYNQVYDELKIWSIRGNCKVRISITETEADYEPYKSNTTKIPLLSPLRSLPDGTCDELIIDRMKKKATLIQRVGVDIYNGSETWGCYNESSSKTVEGYHHTVQNLGGGAGNTNLLSNSFRANYRSIHNRDEEGVGSQQDATYSNVRICISRTRLLPLGYTVGQNQVAYFQKWLQSNPVTVLYPLLTPVVTEIDLENFPLVYKDGHIFLNSEIAPVIEIDYNVNQAQQIQANNETLQRHELDILDLDNLIVSFVNAEYNLRLLKFDMELSMMALAE